MYHPPSKRTQLFQRVAVYAVMSIAVITLVTALVMVILGYRFNREDGQIEQGGLVQFSSQPSGASVALDGVNFGSRTATKTTMTAGSHLVSMSRTGYQEWRKSINVVPGAVLWLNYARLVPTDLPVSRLAEFATVTSSAVSVDKRWMAVKSDVASPEINLFDISQADVVSAKLTLPATSYTQPSEGKGGQQFSLQTWDPSSRYLLVKHTIDEVARPEWLVVDTQNVANTKNITTLLDVDISKLLFTRNNSQVVYAQIGHDVRKIDIGGATLSRPLLSNVAEFAQYRDDTLVFASRIDTTTKQRTVGYYKDGEDASRVVRSYTDDGTTPLHFAINDYFGDTYLAFSYGSGIEVLTGDLPTNSKETDALKLVSKFTTAEPTQFLDIVTDGRFIVAQAQNSYTVYDLELKKYTTTPLKGAASTDKKLEWLDGYMPWSDRDGILRLYEFDGANQHDIMTVVSGQAATLSRNGTYLYAIGKTDDTHYHLQRVQMILP
jgi:hypothetical protein